MKYGFIGCGNMGGAIARGLSQATQDILVTDRSGKARVLARELGISYGTVSEVAACDRIFLGVKPHMMQEVLEPLQGVLAEKKPLLITMAAGLEISKIEAFAGTKLPVLRIMPNTPVNLGSGMIVYATDKVNEEEENEFLQAFKQAGLFDKIEEGFIDAAGALSGCGPAFAYAFARALAKGAEEFGIPQDKANIYAAQTLLGAGEMLLAYKDPDALIKAVCSPGGTTLAGMKALEDGKFEKIATSAVEAAYARTLELKK